MAKNEFLPFATADGANVLSAEDYQTLRSRSNGFSAGVARSQELNTVWRQASVIAHVVAQFIADTNNSDVADDGDLDKLQAGLIQALSKNVNNTVPAASLKTAGIAQLSSATDSDSETMAATPKAVKAIADTLSGGRLLNVQTFTVSGTYTPTPGTRSIIVEVQGAGGGGGGVGVTDSTSVAIGGGGSGGAYAKSRITNLESSYSFTVGAGGSGGVSSNGARGGYSSFANIIAGGGFGGGFGSGSPPILKNSLGIPTASGGNILNLNGQAPVMAIAITLAATIAGGGGSSLLGVGGGTHGTSGAGFVATGFGAGGGGANANANNLASLKGADGANGIVIVWEYS